MEIKKYTKDYLKYFNKVKLNRWIFTKRNELKTGALFTYADNKLGKLIKHFTKKHAIDFSFIPSHVGNIIIIGEDVYVMNIIPPKSTLTRLADYICNADFEYKIICFNDVDAEKYAVDTLKENNKNYGYLSAFQCAFKGLQWLPNLKQHCSEYFIRCLQNQGYFKQIKADDISPVQAYNLLVYNIDKS